MSLSLEQYLRREDTLTDRLQKGPDGTLKRLSNLKDELDKLSWTVAHGHADGSQARRQG
jgi:hypothetical protein